MDNIRNQQQQEEVDEDQSSANDQYHREDEKDSFRNTSLDNSENNDHVIDNDITITDPNLNERLLMIAFITFFTFAIVQFIFAFIAESQAMIGDSVAMIVDAITYLINFCAERTKNQFESESEQLVKETSESLIIQRQRKQRKLTLKLEIIPPLISVTTLIIVTIIVTRKAILVLLSETGSNAINASLQQQPNVDIMLGFSAANLLLDFVNVFCFAKSKHLLGYDTNVEYDTGINNEETNTLQKHSHHQHANLNMCSAYTHVFADTLRSIAVIIASLLSILNPKVRKNVADSSAAIVVSAIIFFTLIPLFRGLVISTKELRSIQYQEKQEQQKNGLQNQIRTNDNENIHETEMV